jgi:F-type H+-transporting ATPase subunit a
MLLAANPLEHVLDAYEFEFFPTREAAWHLPTVFGVQVTKYMVLLLLSAAVLVLIYVPLARSARTGEAPRGPLWNAFEAMLTFIRDNVAKPYLGHDADRYVPFLWTLFLFVLTCNLLGMFPFLGSPTASISVTLGLALIAFVFIHGSAIAANGVGGWWKSFVPHIEAPFGMAYFLVPLMVFLEVFSAFIKAFVLAVRLFANMLAGHTVLASILGFIVLAQNTAAYLFVPITGASVILVVLLSLLELFVAFLQAFIFVFLTTIFLSSTLHPHH